VSYIDKFLVSPLRTTNDKYHNPCKKLNTNSQRLESGQMKQKQH